MSEQKDVSPDEQALHLKELGNKSLQKGSAFLNEAIQYYTQAIELKPQNLQQLSILYSNRAFAKMKQGTLFIYSLTFVIFISFNILLTTSTIPSS